MLNVNLSLFVFFIIKKQTKHDDLDSPVVMIDNDFIQSQLYANVTIECRVLSHPLAHIYWKKNGKRIDNNKMNRIQINQTMSLNRLSVQVESFICLDSYVNDFQ